MTLNRLVSFLSICFFFFAFLSLLHIIRRTGKFAFFLSTCLFHIYCAQTVTITIDSQIPIYSIISMLLRTQTAPMKYIQVIRCFQFTVYNEFCHMFCLVIRKTNKTKKKKDLHTMMHRLFANQFEDLLSLLVTYEIQMHNLRCNDNICYSIFFIQTK